jgi:hypothetical protein
MLIGSHHGSGELKAMLIDASQSTHGGRLLQQRCPRTPGRAGQYLPGEGVNFPVLSRDLDVHQPTHGNTTGMAKRLP